MLEARDAYRYDHLSAAILSDSGEHPDHLHLRLTTTLPRLKR